MLDAFLTDKICWWYNKRGRDTRLLIALKDFMYLVVLTERDDYILFWTAYPIENNHSKMKLIKEYEGYKKAEAAPKDGIVTPSTHGS